MKRILMITLLVFSMPVLGLGAQIFGSLRANDVSVGQNAWVTIQCNGGSQKVQTDDYGSYRIGGVDPKSTGCKLSVYYAGKGSTEWDVYPDDDPVRYDFDLLGPYNGKFSLKRR